jgi:hypothetical protein
MDTTPFEGRPAGLDESLIDKPTHTTQAHGAPTTLKWADEIPDLDMEQPVVGHPAADTEWSSLPKTDVEPLSATDLREHLPPLMMRMTKLQRALKTWLPLAMRPSRKK